MSDYKKTIEYDGKKLPDVFKELKEKQYIEFDEQLENYSKNRKKLAVNLRNVNNFFVVILFVCFIIIMLLTNTISATQLEINGGEKHSKVQFELNDNSIDLMNVLNDNISVVKRKEIITNQVDINFMTTYRDNPNLPKGEQLIVQAGSPGKQELIIVRTYENDELVEENIINTNIYEDSITQIVDIGSSEFLAKLQVHLGDVIYVTEDVSLKESADISSNIITNIPQFFDVKIIESLEEWAKVEFENQIGYVENSVLTSYSLDNSVVDKCRIKKLKLSVDVNMDLNKSSGLTLSDYERVFSNISSDKNKIFEKNAVAFYNIEQKYNINGIFLASIAIHESGWGTSKIAQDKKNLFGYGAYDFSPYESSLGFNSYEDGIEVVARSLVKNYLNPVGIVIYDGDIATGAYYNGPTVAGVNVRYASDTNWHMKIFSKMLYLYERL